MLIKFKQKVGNRFESFKNSYPLSFTKEGNFISFFEQMQSTAHQLPKGSRFVVSLNNEGLEYANINDAPIVVSKKVLKSKHSGIANIINKLDIELKNSVLVMDGYGNNFGNKQVILYSLGQYGKPVLVGLKYQSSSVQEIKVHQIETIHQRNTFESTLKNHLQNGSIFYLNHSFDIWIKQFNLDKELVYEIKKRSELGTWEQSP